MEYILPETHKEYFVFFLKLPIEVLTVEPSLLGYEYDSIHNASLNAVHRR